MRLTDRIDIRIPTVWQWVASFVLLDASYFAVTVVLVLVSEPGALKEMMLASMALNFPAMWLADVVRLGFGILPGQEHDNFWQLFIIPVLGMLMRGSVGYVIGRVFKAPVGWLFTIFCALALDVAVFLGTVIVFFTFLA